MNPAHRANLFVCQMVKGGLRNGDISKIRVLRPSDMFGNDRDAVNKSIQEVNCRITLMKERSF